MWEIAEYVLLIMIKFFFQRNLALEVSHGSVPN
jgi:hypothetical protein